MAAREGFVVVNGLQTKVSTIGGWVEDSLPQKQLIIVIPGNPGLTGYYRTFLATIYSKTGIPVWTLSHAGHELPRDSTEQLKTNLHNYTVQGQTAHKLAFIEKYVPKDVRITFVGHSIGCKIILNALKSSNIANQVDVSYCLFPTIERMAVSPNGKFMVRRVKPFVFLIILASYLFSVLPRLLKKLLISVWFLFDGTSSAMTGVTIGLVRPAILRSVFYMAYDEMDTVTTLDFDTIDKHGSRLVFYYGATDGWAPAEYCTSLKRSFPDVEIHACENGYSHAFVLNASVPVGLMVAEWINKNKINSK